jgi:PTS system nitrogen regulatory IIA component
MPLSELLIAERVGLLIEPGDRDSVLDAAARLLAGSAPAQTDAIAESLRQRERLGSTAIGHGVAIPHGRSSAFDHARAAFLRLSHPVDFAAGDGEPVDLVFAMAVPEHITQQHLQWLAELAERFADAEFRDALRATPDIEALRRLMLARPGSAKPDSAAAA